MDLMQRAGFKAFCSDIAYHHSTEEHDLVILAKPDLFNVESATKHAILGGYILLDSQYKRPAYPGSDAWRLPWLLNKPDAEKLFDKPDEYALEGKILAEDGKIKMDKQNLNLQPPSHQESCWVVFRKR